MNSATVVVQTVARDLPKRVMSGVTVAPVIHLLTPRANRASAVASPARAGSAFTTAPRPPACRTAATTATITVTSMRGTLIRPTQVRPLPKPTMDRAV
nr:hypothetical protein [Streptomyces xanthii]